MGFGVWGLGFGVWADLTAVGGGADDVAVVVGISDYGYLPDVPAAADNARDWAQYLARVRGVPHVTLLVDAEATRERMERALKAAVAVSKPGGRMWFVFVGHGAPAHSAKFLTVGGNYPHLLHQLISAQVGVVCLDARVM